MPSFKYVKGNAAEKESFRFVSVLTGVLIGEISALLLLLLAAWILLITHADMDCVPYIAKAVVFAGAFACGFFGSVKRKNSGWLYGVLGGFLYAVILLIAGALYSTARISGFMSVLTVLLCTITGAIGGIFGINCGKKPKRHTYH